MIVCYHVRHIFKNLRHGETYVHPEDKLWWSRGGELYGTSPTRIAFLRTVLEEAPGFLNRVFFNPHDPVPYWDVAVGAVGEDYYLFYFG